MRRINCNLLVCGIGIFLSIRSVAQVTEGSLSKEFGKPIADKFQVAPGITMQAVYGSSGDVCLLTVEGQATESQVAEIFDRAVPVSVRGEKTGGVVQCIGTCMKSRSFQNVFFSTGVLPGQTATPAALITFSRLECKSVVAEAHKVITQIDRR